MKWPRGAIVFEDKHGEIVEGQGVIDCGMDCHCSLLWVCGDNGVQHQIWVGYAKPLTPGARAMLAIAKGGR